MAFENRFEPFVGIPYLRGGSSRHGANCWGLVRLVYRHLAGVELVLPGDVDARDAEMAAELYQAQRRLLIGQRLFTEIVHDTADLDIVELDPLGSADPVHVGVMANGGLLHTRSGTVSHISPWRAFHGRVRSRWRLASGVAA